MWENGWFRGIALFVYGVIIVLLGVYIKEYGLCAERTWIDLFSIAFMGVVVGNVFLLMVTKILELIGKNHSYLVI